jgi:hypothetical protein
MTIIVSGKLHAEDICFSEIDVGSIVIVWGIPVPIELKTRAFYEVEISITTKNRRTIIHGDLFIEPAKVSAIGQRHDRTFAFSTPTVLDPLDIDGADICMLISAEEKRNSTEQMRFQEALKKKIQ